LNADQHRDRYVTIAFSANRVKDAGMSSVAQRLLTAHEFWRLPPTEAQRELVRGEVIESTPPGGQRGAIAVLLAMLLRL